jgi:dephospho-CoA kinase
VDKPRLARLAFSDDAAREKLEAAIHPLVRAFFSRLATARAADSRIVVLEATRLVEAGYAPDFDLIVTVEAAPEVRLERAVARGSSRDEARRRLTAQGDGDSRRKAAHKVVVNDGSPEALAVQVEGLVRVIRERAAEARRSPF